MDWQASSGIITIVAFVAPFLIAQGRNEWRGRQHGQAIDELRGAHKGEVAELRQEFKEAMEKMESRFELRRREERENDRQRHEAVLSELTKISSTMMNQVAQIAALEGKLSSHRDG